MKMKAARSHSKWEHDSGAGTDHEVNGKGGGKNPIRELTGAGNESEPTIFHHHTLWQCLSNMVGIKNSF